ncbi:MAG TPA: Clp protease N-terminal domain-containing protein [Acidimicrobiales bacterium]|nr:Clp protease N-terminal domain-containing protein [Acidimicrobiales bacterium]
MFERFTDRARRSIVVAENTAREMGHRQIKPEHLLVALTHTDGVAAKAMAESGVDSAHLRARVSARFENDPSAKKLNKVPFSPDAKKALEQSLRAALGLGHNYIGTEHLFFGVQRQAEQKGEAIDELLGVSADDVHKRILQMLEGGRPAASMRSPALHSAMGAAARSAGRAAMTTGHLLVAIAADTRSQGALALATLGVSAEAVTAAVLQVPVADTSDAIPAEQGVAIIIDGVTTLISDPEVATALRGLSGDQVRDIIKRGIGPASPDQAAG